MQYLEESIMKKRLFLLTIIVALLLCLVSSVHAIAITWTTIDYPWAYLTDIYDIDGSNLVGLCDVHGPYEPFFYNGATWTTLDLPGAISGISGCNIVGTYGVSGIAHGFMYDGTGWTTLDYPGASGTSINNIDGDNLVGSADDHGVIYNLDSQTWTIRDFPDPGASWTRITGIEGENNVGYYQDAAYPYNRHSFLYDGSDWTILDLPDEAKGISGANVVTRGGVYNLDSHIWTSLAFPGAFITVINGIDGDNIVGQYVDTDGRKHGFIGTIPEPTTLALFALGVCLLRKQR
jgi:hypothetical protein